MVNCVADKVRQRVADRFDQRFVEFRFATVSLETNLLAASLSRVVHQPWKAVPDIANRLQPRLHHIFLQLGGDQIELPARVLKCGIFVLLAVLQDLIAGQDDLAGDAHQLVEQVDMDADRSVVDGRRVECG